MLRVVRVIRPLNVQRFASKQSSKQCGKQSSNGKPRQRNKRPLLNSKEPPPLLMLRKSHKHKLLPANLRSILPPPKLHRDRQHKIEPMRQLVHKLNGMLLRHKREWMLKIVRLHSLPQKTRLIITAKNRRLLVS